MKRIHFLPRTLRAVYKISPIKRGIFRAGNMGWRKFYSRNPAPVPVIVKMGSPPFYIELDLRDRYQFSMFIKRSHEPDTEILFRQIIRGKKSFLDVGSYIGYYTLQAGAISDNIDIYAFEPFPKNAAVVRRSILRNRFTNIQVEEKAVSDRDGSAKFITPDPLGETGWGFIAGKEPQNSEIFIEVETCSLSEYFKRKGVKNVEVLKIDAEGHELNVIKGGLEILKSPGKREIIIEMNEFLLSKNNVSKDEINDLLLSLGYRAYLIASKGKLKGYNKSQDSPDDMNYYYVKEQ